MISRTMNRKMGKMMVKALSEEMVRPVVRGSRGGWGGRALLWQGVSMTTLTATAQVPCLKA